MHGARLEQCIVVNVAPEPPVRGEHVRSPKRRDSVNYTLVLKATKGWEVKAHVTLGRYADGTVCEVFCNVAKAGSDQRTSYDVWAITASVALQSGLPPDRLAHTLRGVRDDNAGKVLSPPCLEGNDTSSLWDALAQLLEAEA